MMNPQTISSRQVDRRAEGSGSGSPVWWLIFKREFVELWFSGKVLWLLILFSIMMSITAVMQEAESQISTIPPPEIVFIVLQATISFGLFISLIVGADTISGERERATLETLLLTPTSRRQILIGKFLASLSPWPVAMVLSIPYLAVLARGDAVLGQALILGTIMGSLLAVGFTGFGMLVSVWSNSNRVSLFVSMLVYVLLLIPTLWPGAAQKGDLGYALQQLNPMQATSEFLEKVLVNNRTVEEKASYMVAALLSAAVATALLFVYAAPRLRLEASGPRLRLPRLAVPRRAVAAVLLMFGLTAFLGTAAPLQAAAPPTDQPLQIAVDMDHRTLKAGEKIKFTTVVTNSGTGTSAAFHVSMNIIKIGSGDPVDPEDWSPERSQAVKPLAAGKSAKQDWVVNAIMEGNYMVYMTIVPTPAGADLSAQTTSSMGVHLVVKPGEDTNPGGVLPVAIVIPSSLMLGAILLRVRSRRRATLGEGDR